MSEPGGCGGACGCGGGRHAEDALATDGAAPPARINGIALHPAGQRPDDGALRELAWAELLRQEASRQGLLPAHAGGQAPALQPREREVIEAMLERSVRVPQPTDDECRRYYDARKDHYVEGRMAMVRHILFAVTAGVDVHALAARAEAALLELSREDTALSRFAELARGLSNCPSGADGGALGWIAPQDCADEFARELFGPSSPQPDVGLLPRLAHTRHGFHIVEVLDRRPGRQLAFEDVRPRIAVQLAQQSRAQALHQYVQLLAGQARVEGVLLESSGSPLVQ